MAHGDRYCHTVVALDGDFAMAKAIPDALAVEYVLADHDKRAGLLNVPAFRTLLRGRKPDVLVTYNWGAIEWSLANRWFPVAPHIHIEDGFGPEEANRQLARRVWLRRIALSGKHTRVVVPSRQLERIARNVWHLPGRGLRYLPNGVDCSRFVSRTDPRESSRPLVIGTVAALRPEKNIGRLIHAFAALAQERPSMALELVIVGDGPEGAALKATAQATGRGSQIRFTGATPTPELALREMDIFAISSNTEQMPLSVLEAMATGLPISSVAVGDISEMVAEENLPYVARQDDELGFRDSLRSLLDDANLREKLGRANRAIALARFDRAQMAARYLELFG